jgi:hypothetical protein
MLITQSYLGTSRGPYRCLFFLLLEDYIEAQTQFVQELELYLERFARQLGDAGVVVRPFTSDIAETRRHVLDKSWEEREIEEIRKTPSLLMIGEDFDAFDPRDHSWIHLNFGKRVEHGIPGLSEFRDTLAQLADAVQDSTEDVFAVAQRLIHRVRLADAAEVFEAKPGVCGFSIDLIRGAQLVTELCRGWRGRR